MGILKGITGMQKVRDVLNIIQGEEVDITLEESHAIMQDLNKIIEKHELEVFQSVNDKN